MQNSSSDSATTPPRIIQADAAGNIVSDPTVTPQPDSVKIVPWPDDSLFRAAENPERPGTWLLVDGSRNIFGVVRDGMTAEIICRATHYFNRAVKEHKATVIPPVE